MENKRYRGMLFATVGGIFWGLSGVFGQYLFINNDLNAKWLVSVRLFIAGLLLLIIVYIKNGNKVFDVIKKKNNWPLLILYSIFGMGLCQFSYYTTVELSNAGTATVIQYTGPALIILYFCIVYKKKPTLIQILALIMSMTGVAFLATKGDFTSLSISKEALFWGIISAIALAAYNIMPARLTYHYGTLSIMGWGMFISGILLSLYVKPWHVIGHWDTMGFISLGVVIIVGTILAFSLYMEGVKLAGAQTASLIASVEPVTATIATVLLMNISFTAYELLGIGLILVAVAMLSLKKEDE